MNTNEQTNPFASDQLDPNRAVVPHPNYQSPISEKAENQPNQVLPQVTASNTTYYYDVGSAAGAPQIFVVPPEAPPPPPGQAFQRVVPPHPLQPNPITPMPFENVVPPPPKVTTYVTSSEYREGEPVTPMPPPQAYPQQQQPVQEPREEVVRVIVTDDRDYIDRDFYYYRDGAVASMTAWMLFAFGWLVGPLWWIGACFIVSHDGSARVAGVLNLIFGVFWIITFTTLLAYYY